MDEVVWGGDEQYPTDDGGVVTLSRAEAQRLVVETVSTQAESLLRVAQRHSMCTDDAHDAYQRGMEIFMRRASSLDPDGAPNWLHKVVKHEAMAVRRMRTENVAEDYVDLNMQISVTTPSPEERVLADDRVARTAEALQRLKPQEVRAMWLRALRLCLRFREAHEHWADRADLAVMLMFLLPAEAPVQPLNVSMERRKCRFAGILRAASPPDNSLVGALLR